MGFDFQSLDEKSMKTVSQHSRIQVQTHPQTHHSRHSIHKLLVSPVAPAAAAGGAGATRHHSLTYPQGVIQALVNPKTPRHSMQFPMTANPARSQAEARQVRETISIREQQQALIAQRRQEALEGAPRPTAAKDLAIRPWNPDDDRKTARPVRPNRDNGPLLTVSTGLSDKDIVLASRVSLSCRSRGNQDS